MCSQDRDGAYKRFDAEQRSAFKELILRLVISQVLFFPIGSGTDQIGSNYLPPSVVKLPRKKRPVRKESRTGFLGLVVLVVLFVGIAFLIATPPSSHTASQKTKYESAVRATTSPSFSEKQTLRAEDAFYGSITNISFGGQTTGVVEADTNCKSVPNGLTNCLAIIRATDGSEIDFNYSHDMSKQPCLAAGNQVTITLLNDGTVKIIRG